MARLQVDSGAGPSSGKEVKEGTRKKQHKTADDEVRTVQCCDFGRLQLLVHVGFPWWRRRTAVTSAHPRYGLRCMLCCVCLRRDTLQGMLVFTLVHVACTVDGQATQQTSGCTAYGQAMQQTSS